MNTEEIAMKRRETYSDEFWEQVDAADDAGVLNSIACEYNATIFEREVFPMMKKEANRGLFHVTINRYKYSQDAIEGLKETLIEKGYKIQYGMNTLKVSW